MRIFQQAVEKTGELLGIAAGVSFRSPFIALGIAMSLSVLAFQSAKDLKIDGNPSRCYRLISRAFRRSTK